MDTDHEEEGLASGQPCPHDDLHQGLSLLLEIIDLHLGLDAQLVEQLVGLILLEVHDGVEHLVDGVEDELAEGPDVVLGLGLGPLLGLQVEEVLT